jgi:hypothetical protein
MTPQTTCKDLNLIGNTLCCGCLLRVDQPESKYKKLKYKCKRLWNRAHRQVLEGKRGRSQQHSSYINTWRQLIAMGHPEPTGWAELIESKPERNAELIGRSRKPVSPPATSPASPELTPPTPPLPPPEQQDTLLPPPEQQDSINPILTNPITQKRVRPGSLTVGPSKKSKTATLPPRVVQIKEYFAKTTPTERARIVDGLLTELQKTHAVMSSLSLPRTRVPCEAIRTLQSQNIEVVTVVDVSSDESDVEEETPAENDDEDAIMIETCSCQNNREATKCGQCYVTDLTLSNGHIVRHIPNNWVLITTSEKAKYDNERAIVDAIRRNVKYRKRNNPTKITRMLFGAFAASQPKVPTSTQEILSAISRHAFFLEIEAILKDDGSFNPSRYRWLFDFKNVLNTNPTRTSIDNWVVELAQMQAVIAADFFLNRASSIFLQCDGGHDGKEVKMLTGWDPNDKTDTPGGSVRQVLLDVDAAGKKAVKLAEGIDASLCKVGITRDCGKRLDGLVVDSGAGTPESLQRALVDIDRMTAEGFDDSCGLHDCQSIFRLAIQHYIGDGGLGKRNAVQCNHAVYDMFARFSEYMGYWRDFVTKLYNQEHPGVEAPNELITHILEPIITRWWTLGECSRFLVTHWYYNDGCMLASILSCFVVALLLFYFVGRFFKSKILFPGS